MKLIVCNHKMNLSLEEEKNYSQELDTIESENKIIICPSYPYLSCFSSTHYDLGAQDVSEYDSGNHTGEVSASQLRTLGVKYCLVGHSERRKDHGETASQIIAKINQLGAQRIIPILCIGEQKSDFEKKEECLKKQLDEILPYIDISKLLIAYEPVWAIGTGRSPAISEVVNTVCWLREHIKSIYSGRISILYGGSIDCHNIKEWKQIFEIDGFLIGGTSLKIDNMKQIIREMEEIV